jgi:2-keto-3-deoxy-L-fuconate dehydrogenase
MPAPIALITGAASGIGAATAQLLAHEGVAGLALLDRDGAGLERLVASLPDPDIALAIEMDVADEADWSVANEAVRTHFGRLDWAVANAGISTSGRIEETAFAEWRRVQAINLDGVFLTLSMALPAMRAGGNGGAIVVVSSASGVKAEIGTAAYGASKAGALQLAKVAAKEGAPDGVRVNALLPGGVETPIWRQAPFFADLVAEKGNERAAFDAMAAMATPLGRYATAEETAALILFLLRDAVTMTGAALLADGGYTL